MKPLTVKELKRQCEIEILKGNGDKVIMITDDDECNGYHYLWSPFITVEEYEKPVVYEGQKYELKFEFADESVAKKEDTIILG
jgi:hypothetical protein